MREDSGAWFSTGRAWLVDDDALRALKERAQTAPRRRFRICLHHTPADSVQDMVIACCRDSYVRPHRHSAPVTFQIIEGTVMFLCFDNAGRVQTRYTLSTTTTGGPLVLRLDAGVWYMPLCRSDLVVFRETLCTANPDGRATEYADWSPSELDAASAERLLREREALP